MYRSTSDYSLAPPSHSLIASPVHVIIPPHQHSNSNCQYRNSHITVIMKFSTVKTSRIQKADGAADGQDIESRTHYYTRINRDYRENNFHSIYYHHPHLLCSYLPSSYKPIPFRNTWTLALYSPSRYQLPEYSPIENDCPDAFDHSHSWDAFAFCPMLRMNLGNVDVMLTILKPAHFANPQQQQQHLQLLVHSIYSLDRFD